MDQYAILWEQLQNGNRIALSKIFKIFYPRLFDYGIKLVTDREVVKDSIQEIFANLWEYHSSLKKINSVSAYLISSLRRTVIRKAIKNRKTKKEREKIRRNIFSDILNIEEVIILFESKQKEQEQLKMALQELSPRQKEAIYLRYYEGLSPKEISGIFGVNVQSVYNLLTESIKRLKWFIHAREGEKE